MLLPLSQNNTGVNNLQKKHQYYFETEEIPNFGDDITLFWMYALWDE